MLKAEIAGNTYHLPITYRDVTLKQYIALYKILIKYDNLDEVKNGNKHEFLQMYKEVFLHFIPIKEEVFMKIPTQDITNTVNMMREILTPPKDEALQFFDFEGDRYYFPKPVYEEESFGAYIESSHLLSTCDKLEGGQFDIIAEHMAIMCRKRGEEYSDKLVKERTELFQNLSMQICWQYSFFLSRQKQTYESNMRHYSKVVAVTSML